MDAANSRRQASATDGGVLAQINQTPVLARDTAT